MITVRNLIKCEIKCMCKNSDNLRLEFDETKENIYIKAYFKDETTNSFILRGNAIEIQKNGEGFKSGRTFNRLKACDKARLINMACYYCNINAGRGENYGINDKYVCSNNIDC